MAHLHVSSSYLKDYAKNVIEDGKDDRSGIDAQSARTIDATQREAVMKDKANQDALVQGGFQIAQQVVSVAQSAKGAGETTKDTVKGMEFKSNLATAETTAKSTGSMTALMDTKLTDKGTKVSDVFSKDQMKVLLSGEAFTPESLKAAGFKDEKQISTLMDMQKSNGGKGISTDQAVEFVFNNRNAKVDDQAAQAKTRENAVRNLIIGQGSEGISKVLSTKTEKDKKAAGEAGDDKTRAKDARASDLDASQEDGGRMIKVSRTYYDHKADEIDKVA